MVSAAVGFLCSRLLLLCLNYPNPLVRSRLTGFRIRRPQPPLPDADRRRIRRCGFLAQVAVDIVVGYSFVVAKDIRK